MWFSHKNIGAHAANVPQDVPVATESTAVTKNETTATVLPVTPRESAIFTKDAPTPVDINASAIAYASISMKKTRFKCFTLSTAQSTKSLNLNLSVNDATINAYIVAIGAAIKQSIPEIIKPASTNTGENLNSPTQNPIR
ncbi:hypothetical protein SDC9_158972 [bioreactor metagenome]|uniref:Uncharacterized protein n=1 Tax=bioreactor metagenome TaxID=1076179 RepID=A0A645FBC6_9ZZZZ